MKLLEEVITRMTLLGSTMVCLNMAVSGQIPNGFLDFGTTTNGTVATTANTGMGAVRVGTGGGDFTIQNQGQPIGEGGEIRGIAPTTASINSIGITSTEFGVAASTFTISFEVHFSGGASGTWYFFAGNGATFNGAQTLSFTGNQVFTGIQWIFGGSNAIVTNNRSDSNWTAISGNPFAQSTAYYVTIVGNNSVSTVTYGSAGYYAVAANTYDLWVNGVLVGDNLAKALLPSGTDINAFRFYGENSAGNVATIALDNIRWYHSCVLPPTHITLAGVATTGIVGVALPTYTAEVRSGSPTGPIANLFTGTVMVTKATGSGGISGTLIPNAVAGVATYNNTQIDTAGTYTIVAASTAPIVSSASSAAILITPGCTAPVTQAHTIVFHSVTTTTANIAVTRGNGDRVLIIGREGTPIETNPAPGTSYAANQSFGTGGAVGTGFALYDGVGSGMNLPTGTIPLNNLTTGTTYYIGAYEYHDTDVCYNTAGSPTGSFTTVCEAPVSTTPVSVGSKSFTASWNASTGAAGYSLDYSTVSDFSSGVTTIDSIVGTSLLITELEYTTTYYFRVRAVNIAGLGSTNSNVSTVTTLGAASGLVLVGVPSSGFVNTYLSSFTVEARRADATVDDAFANAIIISKVSGSGNIDGTKVVVPENGVATIDEVWFDTIGMYTIHATDGVFTSPTSGGITITNVSNATATLWNGGSSAWLSPANWSLGLPDSTTVAQFGNANQTTVGFNMNGASVVQRTIGAIEFVNGANSRTIQNSSGTVSNTFILSGVGLNAVANVILRNNSSNTITIANGSSQSLGIELGNPINNVVSIDDAGSILINCAISGTNRLTKQGSGSGILQLTDSNTYTGLTTVMAGTLQLNRAGGTTIPVTNDVCINGGNLQVSTNQTLNNIVLSSGTLTVDAGVILTINGTLTLTSGNISGAGTIVYGPNGALVYNGIGPQTSTDAEWPPSGGPNSVTIGINGMSLHDSRTINDTCILNGKLTIGANTLTLEGNISGSGTISGGILSHLIVNGSGHFGEVNMDQTSAATRTLQSLTINRADSGFVIINDSLNIARHLTLNNGTLVANGLIKLLSVNGKTAVIPAINGTGNIIGNVTVECYVSNAGRKWRFLSSPFSDATFEDWQQEIFITGAGMGNTAGTLNSNGFDATSSNQPSVYSYNETATGDMNHGWVALTNSTPSLSNQIITAGKGYRVFVRGDRSDIGRLTGANLTSTEVLLNLTGTINTGDIIMPVTYTVSNGQANDGWNLLGNPYPCAYNWNVFRDAGSGMTNIDSTIYILDATTGSYKSYNSFSDGGSLTNGVIPSGASFWVKANGANPALIFTEQYKTTESSEALFKTNTSNELNILLELDSVTKDNFILAHRLGSTVLSDAYDIKKLNGVINIMSVGTDGISLTFDARPELLVNDTVQLYVSGGNNTYTLKANTVPVGGKFYYLIDRKLGSFLPLSTGFVYSYTSSATDTLSYGYRFQIVISNSSSLPVLFKQFTAQQQDEVVLLNWATASESNSKNFEVQRSTNERQSWELIALVEAAGYSNDERLYQYTDIYPDREVPNYYRIKQVDVNGNISYSGERVVVFEQAYNAMIVPNPATDIVNIQSAEPPAKLELLDSNGRSITETNQATMNLTDTPSGVYLIRVTKTNGDVVIQKLLKQ